MYPEYSRQGGTTIIDVSARMAEMVNTDSCFKNFFTLFKFIMSFLYVSVKSIRNIDLVSKACLVFWPYFWLSHPVTKKWRINEILSANLALSNW